MADSPTPYFAHEQQRSAEQGYRHDFHAGNVGDVWKHVALLAVLDSLVARAQGVHCIDTHAGRGSYDLQSTGEWTEGVGALARVAERAASPLVRRYLDFVAAAGFTPRGKCPYPGSPHLVARSLRPNDALTLCEIESGTLEALRGVMAKVFPAATIVEGDGLNFLRTLPPDERSLLVHIDPPWSKKQDWTEIPRVLLELQDRLREATVMLWYPIKSYTRIAAMCKQLEAAQSRFVSADLITFPLALQRNRLNGSGLLLWNVAPETVTALAAAGSEIGAACGIKGHWELRMVSR